MRQPRRRQQASEPSTSAADTEETVDDRAAFDGTPCETCGGRGVLDPGPDAGEIEPCPDCD